MAGGNKGANRELAVGALALGKTVGEAAAAASVDERTVYRWLTQKEFRNRVNELRTAAISAAVGKMAAALSRAVEKLVELSESGARDDVVQLKACQVIVASMFQMCEMAHEREYQDSMNRLGE